MSNCDAVQVASLRDQCRKSFKTFEVLAMFHQHITLDRGWEEGDGQPSQPRPRPQPRDPVSA